MIRHNLQDFIADVRSRSSAVIVFTVVINRDQTIQILKNGEVIFKKIRYDGTGLIAPTDANPTGDHVTVYSTDGPVAKADASAFLNGLHMNFVPPRKKRDF